MDLAPYPALDGFPEHRRVLERALAHFQGDRRVIGLMVGGSVAGGVSDVYSDIDLYIVARDGYFDALLAEREAAALAIGAPLFRFVPNHIPHGGEEMYIVLYEGPVKLDLNYLRASQVKPEPRMAKRLIAKDPDRLLAGAQRASREVPPPTPSRETMLALNQKFWTWCWYVFGKIMRGELWEALDGLHGIRSMALLVMLDWAAGREHEGYRRLESKLDDESSRLLPATVSSLDIEGLYKALQIEIALFQSLRSTVFARHGLTVDPAPERALTTAMARQWSAR